MRRHRRDTAYLAWVLRNVATSSSLALALLGFSAVPAAAEFPPFVSEAAPNLGTLLGDFTSPALGDLNGDGRLDLIIASDNFGGKFSYYVGTGSQSISIAFGSAPFPHDPLYPVIPPSFNPTAALGDLDHDGDLDLVAGEYDGVFHYYENTGTANVPVFVERTGSANPLDGEDVGSRSAPCVGDLDGDGDLDLLAGTFDGTFRYYENTGSATTPVFVLRTGSADPMTGQDAGSLSHPSFGDIDSDGDLDLVVGRTQRAFLTYENMGSAIAPVFVLRTGADDPLAGFDPGGYDAAPILGDIDSDGDMDLLSGNLVGTVVRFRNQDREFVKRTGASSPFDGLAAAGKPAFGDLDGDGDADLVVGEATGAFAYFENVGSVASPSFVARTGTANPLNGQDVGTEAAPTFGDLDGDGDLDLVSGSASTNLHYFENVGAPASPAFVLRTGTASPVSGYVGTFVVPTLVDIDDDGDLDLFIGKTAPFAVAFLENVGTSVSPLFVFRSGSADPLDGFELGAQNPPRITFGDLDHDGDLDAIVGGRYGFVTLWENIGTSTQPEFAIGSNLEVSVSHVASGPDLSPALVDLDADGDLELAVGTPGTLAYFENHLSTIPVFVEQTGSANPLAGEDVGALSSATLADLDGDGDADLIAGDATGAFSFFENSGNAVAPVFTQRTGGANPLSGFNVGSDSTLSLADLDRDGDFDLVAGRYAGGFDYFENTGDATTPLFVSQVTNAFGLDASCTESSAPVFGDVDRDGDLDLVAGCYVGFSYFENVGLSTNPDFEPRAGSEEPLDGVAAGSYPIAALADFDRDGNVDLVVGAAGGKLRYFKNAGELTFPASKAFFSEVSPAQNPFAGLDVGQRAAPASADLNGDGTPDLVTGALDGTFTVHYVPEPGADWMLGAGAFTLKGLDRVRRRRDRVSSRKESHGSIETGPTI